MDGHILRECVYIYRYRYSREKQPVAKNIYIYIYFLQYVSFQDILLNRANIAAEILHVHGVILILT